MSSDIEKLKLSSPGLIPLWAWNSLVDYVHSSLVTSFVGGWYSRTPGGTTLFARGGDAGNEFTHPFQCTLVPQSNSDGTPAGNKVKIEFNSILFTSRIPLVPFSGLTGLYDPGDTTPGLLDLDGPDDTTGYTSPSGPDDYVFLEVKMDSTGLVVDTVAVETNGNGSTVDPTYSAWDASGDALTAMDSTTGVQTYARIVLATYQDGELQQNVIGNLVIDYCCIDGYYGAYPFPY